MFSHGSLLLSKRVNYSSYLPAHQLLCDLCLKQTVFKLNTPVPLVMYINRNISLQFFTREADIDTIKCIMTPKIDAQLLYYRSRKTHTRESWYSLHFSPRGSWATRGNQKFVLTLYLRIIWELIGWIAWKLLKFLDNTHKMNLTLTYEVWNLTFVIDITVTQHTPFCEVTSSVPLVKQITSFDGVKI